MANTSASELLSIAINDRVLILCVGILYYFSGLEPLLGGVCLCTCLVVPGFAAILPELVSVLQSWTKLYPVD